MANLSKEAREDRKQKEASQLYKRSNTSYIEIEAFKEYEFSQCISFEMAIRNPKLKETIERFIDFYKRHKERIKFIPEDISFFEEAFGYRLHRRAQDVFIYWYQYIEQELWLKPIDLYYVIHEEITLEMAEVYMHMAYNIQEQTANEEFSIESEEGVHFESSVDLKNEHYFKDKDEVSKEDIIEAFKSFDMDASMIESEIKVTENYSRPKLSIPALFNRNVQLELNLALPEAELLSYVRYIKNKYDKDKNIIKSAVELLGGELSAAGFLESGSDKMYKKDRRKTLTEKCADLFFIYDNHSNNLSMDYTLEHLNRYWNEERNAFPEQFQEKTYKLYLKLAKDFIENQKYKSLLIGQ